MQRIVVAPFLVAVLALASAMAMAQTAPSFAGVVVSHEARALRVKTPTGQDVDVKLADDTRVALFTPQSLDDIKPGTFVGATAKPGPDGTLVASEVHIFPEALRGTGEGHYPMKSMPGNTMTNATVSRVTGAPGSTTNATVANGRGRMLHLTYKGGAQDILVPADTPVVLYERGDVASLAPGAHVIVRGTTSPDGALTASRISVGKNGSVPPL